MAGGWRNWNPVRRPEGAVETPEQQPAAGLRPKGTEQAKPQAGWAPGWKLPQVPNIRSFLPRKVPVFGMGWECPLGWIGEGWGGSLGVWVAVG